MSDIEGKAARVAASECGQRASFNARGLHKKGQKDGYKSKKEKGKNMK